MKIYDHEFPNSSFPSGPTCQRRLVKLLAKQKDNRDNSKWKSGTSEEESEVTKGLEEILLALDNIQDQSDLDKQIAADREANASAQEKEALNGHITPLGGKR
jgi:hypothetical protein